MLLALDRFVLSRIEKTTQFLQKHFNIKASDICAVAAATCITLAFLRMYFDPKGVTTTEIITTSIYVLMMSYYIFFYAKEHQKDLEDWAAAGVSNPYKIQLVLCTIRVIFVLVIIIQALFRTLYATNTQELISFLDSISYYIFISVFCVDVLPPSSSKEGSWIKNLFRRRVTSA